MNKVRFGLIGAGIAGKYHAKAISAVPNAELIAVSTKTEVRGKELAKLYNIEWYSDYRKMLERKDIDAISISTPSGMHCEMALDCAEAGKHILVEKPIEVTLEKIDKMIKKAREKEVKLGVVFQSRYLPGAKKLKEEIIRGSNKRIIVKR